MAMNGTDPILDQVSRLSVREFGMPSQPVASSSNLEPPALPTNNAAIIVTDITTQFLDAAQQLEDGDLVCDPHFTLFEAVGALEIMDPKMDSGCLAEGETMEDEYDFGRDLLPEEVLGIIDQLLCHEMAWHFGHPLSQTIFTSVYIDKLLSSTPTSLDHTYFDRSESASASEEPLTIQVLRAYCLGLVKTCGYVNNRVMSEHYYEEEDFCTHTFHRDLLEDLDDKIIWGFIQDTKKKLETSTIPQSIKAALTDQLDFRSNFMKTVKLTDMRDHEESIKEQWGLMLALLPALKGSAELGKPLPEAFSDKIQRKLASTVPPRPIVKISRDDAFGYLERLCRDGSSAAEVLKYHDSHSLRTFVMLFMAKNPQPLVYIRAVVQYYVFGDMIMLGKKSIREILDDDLAILTLAAHPLLDRLNDEIEVPPDPRFIMAQKMEAFRQRVAASYLDILRAFCQNRCRTRRTLTHLIVDWDNVQLDAEEIDIELRIVTREPAIFEPSISDEPIYAYPLSSWAYYHKLEQMEWIILLDLELETYTTVELSGMYWYLRYLAQTRSSHLERIRCFVQHAYMSQGPRDPASAQGIRESLDYLHFAFAQCTATEALADSLSALYEVLRRLKLLPPLPISPYSTLEMRHETRFKPFATIGLPACPSHVELKAQVENSEMSDAALLEYAARCQAGAKKTLENLSRMSGEEAWCRGSEIAWKTDVKGVFKACISTGLAIASVKTALGRGAQGMEIRVEMAASGKGYHAAWVVPNIIRVT